MASERARFRARAGIPPGRVQGHAQGATRGFGSQAGGSEQHFHAAVPEQQQFLSAVRSFQAAVPKRQFPSSSQAAAPKQQFPRSPRGATEAFYVISVQAICSVGAGA
eukprot:11201867-Lingulodinium_polyedra.AAC.2